MRYIIFIGIQIMPNLQFYHYKCHRKVFILFHITVICSSNTLG